MNIKINDFSITGNTIIIFSIFEEVKLKELYLKTEHGLQKIDEKLIEKYNLSQGKIAPFSRYWVVDENGSMGVNNPADDTSSPGLDEMPAGEGAEDDEIVEFSDTGAIFSQSEIIDFSHGTDSE